MHIKQFFFSLLIFNTTICQTPLEQAKTKIADFFSHGSRRDKQYFTRYFTSMVESKAAYTAVTPPPLRLYQKLSPKAKELYQSIHDMARTTYAAAQAAPMLGAPSVNPQGVAFFEELAEYSKNLQSQQGRNKEK